MVQNNNMVSDLRVERLSITAVNKVMHNNYMIKKMVWIAFLFIINDTKKQQQINSSIKEMAKHNLKNANSVLNFLCGFGCVATTNATLLPTGRIFNEMKHIRLVKEIKKVNGRKISKVLLIHCVSFAALEKKELKQILFLYIYIYLHL